MVVSLRQLNLDRIAQGEYLTTFVSSAEVSTPSAPPGDPRPSSSAEPRAHAPSRRGQPSNARRRVRRVAGLGAAMLYLW